MYASTYFNMAEQFKIYLNSLPPEEIDEIENDFRVNGNDLLSVKQKVQPNYLILLHDRLLYTDKHLFVPDGKTSPGIIGEKLSLKESLQNFLGQVQVVLFHLHFLLPSCCFLPEQKR